MRLFAATLLLPFALSNPLPAQTPPLPAGEQTILLKQVGADGAETVQRRTLGAGQSLTIDYVDGKAIASQVYGTAESRRVIIQLKGRPLVHPHKRGRTRIDTSAAKQALDSARGSFKGRLQTLENRHRATRGLAARASATTVTHEYTYCFNGVAAQVNDESLAEIRQMSEVEAVYPDQMRYKCDGYGIGQIGAPAVWQQIGATGRGVVIAVVDTGIHYRHPDLGAGFGPDKKVAGGYDFVNKDTDPDDDNGHGTHVAGIAAANGQTKGVAPDATLLAVKVLDARGAGMDSDIIAGIDWAVANGADIINLSLGGAGTPDDAISQSVDRASEAGVLVVAAAGNSGNYESVGSPAAARTALAVGADDQNSQIAVFSSRGPAMNTFQIKPELVAPGAGIVSTVPFAGTEISHPTGYAALNGTSMASPHAAGAAALLLQQHPDWAPARTKLALVAGAVDIGQNVMTQGSGELDVFTSATLPVLCTEGELHLGWDDLRYPTFTSNQSLTYTNVGAAPVELTLTTRCATPPGMQVAVAPATLSLQPGESRTATFTVNVDNQVTPNAPAAPFTYEGWVVATLSSGQVLQRPFALCKAPKLRIAPNNILLAAFRFHGADAPAFRFMGSALAYEQLVPEGTYDFLFNFLPYTSYPPQPRYVLREKVEIRTFTDLVVSTFDAKNKLEFQPIDELGNPMFPVRSDLALSLTHKASGSQVTTLMIGMPFSMANGCLLSDFGDAFEWDATLGSFPTDPSRPFHVFSASLHQGLAAPRQFTFTAADFRKTVVVHHGRAGQGTLKVNNWIGLQGAGQPGVYSGKLTSAAPSAVEQTVYSTITPDAQARGGFWASEAVGETPSGNLPAPDPGTLYKSAAFRPESPEILVGRNRIGAEVLRSSAQRLHLGRGAAHWSGSFKNARDRIRLQTDAGNLADQKLFNSQCQEELIHGLLTYTLARRGCPLSSGTIDTAMQYVAGQTKNYVAELDVAPGAYELTIPFTEFLLGGSPGQLEVVNKFDTTRADPNPPYLTAFQVTDPLDCPHLDPFLDLLPVTGGELRFSVEDDVKVRNVTIALQLFPNVWLPLPLQALGGGQYATYLPWLGFAREALQIRLVATDSAGNSLTMTETIPCERR